MCLCVGVRMSVRVFWCLCLHVHDFINVRCLSGIYMRMYVNAYLFVHGYVRKCISIYT